MENSASKVRVMVRCRPPSESESRNRKVVSVQRDKLIIGEKVFSFDAIFDETTTQSRLFESCAESLVSGCFEGFNATIFAYGQTGSGKTHSILGSSESEDDEGMIPRVLREIFQRLKLHKDSGGSVLNLKISFLEIYNDECRDLLHPEISSRDIVIREDKEGKIFFTGARDEVIQSFEDALYFLDAGGRARTTAETFMNASSSRSHAIFTISMELLAFVGEGSAKNGAFILSKINLVDLAGSERAKRTMATGARLKESVGINQGLLALGKVIRALTTAPTGKGSQVPAHIPYRESKLTRFLQDALGGNSRTVMLACISCAEVNLHETLNTLQYASRARSIQNRVIANVVTAEDDDGGGSLLQLGVQGSLVDALRGQLRQLETELEDLRSAPMKDAGLPQGIPGGLDDARALLAHATGSLDDILFSGSLDRRVAEQLKVTSKECREVLDLLRRVSVPRSSSQPQLSVRASWMGGAGGGAGGVVEGSLRRSLADDFVSQRQNEDIKALRLELEECREDLKRDEEIFGEKVRELKKARKQIKQLQEENALLQRRVAGADGMGMGMSASKVMVPPPSAGTGGGHAATKQRGDTFGDQSVRDGHVRSATSNGWMDAAPEISEEDDLDISVAVVATEPDISQLMEDLEIISREKDKLEVDKVQAEQKCASVNQAAEFQIADYQRRQQSLLDQMKALEETIADKQALILELKANEQQASQLADHYEARAKELERESRSLRQRLSDLDQHSESSKKVIEEEKNKRREYEAKLVETQEQLKVLEQKREERLKDQNSRMHLDELNRLREEYEKLNAQLQSEEFRQKKSLESLTQQVSQYKKKSVESLSQIKELESKNANLRSRLDRMTRVSRQGGDRQMSDAAELPVRHATPVKASGRSTAPPLSSGKKNARVVAAREGKQGESDVLWELVQRRIDDAVTKKSAQIEISRLTQRNDVLNQEKRELGDELKAIMSKKTELEDTLSREASEINSRVSKLLQEMKKCKQRMSQIDTATSRGESDMRAEKERLAEYVVDLKSKQDRLDDVRSRLQDGVLSADLSQRVLDLQEELETLDTEIELNDVRLREESQKVRRFGGDLPQDQILTVDVEAEVSEQDAACSSAVLEQLARQLVELKFRILAEDGSSQVLRSQLEAKEVELEELQATMNRSRNEFLRRQEQAKREGEDKIAFLLQQLRQVESRGSVDRGPAGGSPQRPGSASTVPRRILNIHEGEESLHSEAVYRSDTKLFEAVLNNSGVGIRPKSSAGPATPSTARRLSDTGLTRQSRDGGSPSASGDFSTSTSQQQQQQEILRRWLSEKERREQLEKRNGELFRELRMLRSQLNSQQK